MPEEELPGAGSKASDAGERPKIDRPNPPALVRKVRLRDGLRCTNPLCRRFAHLQANHIEPRAEGGPTELANQNLFCVVCHSAYHQGLIEI